MAYSFAFERLWLESIKAYCWTTDCEKFVVQTNIRTKVLIEL